MGYQQKSYKKFVATAATATLVASAIVPVASAAGFKDVSADNEFAPFINALVDEGIINGYASDNTFRPNNKLTRGQVAIMLGRWLENNGETVPADWNTVSRFDDVPAGATSAAGKELAKYAALVKDSGVFTGVLGNLNPGQNITRENMAVVLDRVASTVAGISLVELAEEIEDVKVNDLANAQTAYQDEIQALADLGITTVSNFRPKEQVSRAQFAKFLYTTLEIIQDVTAPLSAEELKAEVASIVGTLPEVNSITTVEKAQAAKTTAAEATKALADIEKVIADGEYTEAEVTDLNKVVADAKTAVAAVVAQADKVIEAAKELTVQSVNAINASEVQVNFSAAVDSKTALDAANYEIKVNNSPVTIATNAGKPAITLSTDGKTATIRLATAFQAGDKYVIQTNDAIKSLDGKTAVKYVSEEKVFAESAAPKLLSVAANGTANQLTLEFDRPVTGSTPLVKVDGYDIDGTTTSPTPLTATSNAAGNYKYTVNVTDAVAQNTIFGKGTHEVIVYDVEDTASAYKAKASVLNGSYTITDTVTVPVVEDAIAVNANRFFLQTNVAVDLSTAKLKVEKGNHEFALNDDNNFTTDLISGTETVVDAFAGTYQNKPGVWVVVSDDVDGNDENPLYKGTETAATLKVTLENFKDAATNSLIGEKAVKNVTLNKNNSKPVVESTKVNGTNLEVTFTEELVAANTTFDKEDVVVRNKDGVIISTVSAAAITADGEGLDKVVQIQLGSAYKQADEPYSVEFKAGELKYKENNSSIAGYLVNTVKNDKINTVVKSTSTNFLYTELPLTDVGAGSLANAGDVKVSTGVNGKDTIEIYYGREMTDSARTVANYTLDGKALPAGTTVDFVDGKDKVRIVLPEGSLKASTSYKLAVSTNVKTSEGSTIVGSLQTKAQTEVVISLDDNIAPELTAATYLRADEEVKTTTSTKYVELTFSEVVTATDVANAYDDLKVVVAGSTIDVVGIIENQNATGTNVTDNKLIVVLDTAVNVSQQSTISVVAEADQKGDKTTYIVDAAGNKAKAGSEIKTSGSKYSTQYAGSLTNAAAAQPVITEINGLPAVNTLTLANKSAVDTAKANYDALTTAQKALVDAEVGTKLTDAVAKIAALVALNSEAVKITAAGITDLDTADNVLTQAQSLVDSAYVVTIKSSANSAINGTTGAVTQPASGETAVTGDVVFTVSKDGLSQDVTVSLTVQPTL